MKLNIHLVSHPLIQNLSNIADETLIPQNVNYQASRHLGLFMMYETIRKWIKIYNLTIKQIECKKEVVIIDPKESYLIIFNDIKCFSMFQEVQLLLPKVDLKLIDGKNLEANTKKALDPTLKRITLYTKVVIVNYDIDIEYTTNVVNLLKQNNDIKLHQISIICIKCATNQLIQLSENNVYKDLTIYTAKIVDD